VSSYNSSKLDQISTYRLAKEKHAWAAWQYKAYKKIYISRRTNVVYIFLTVSIKVYPDTRSNQQKFIYWWDVDWWDVERNSEIFWFPKYRQDANCIQIVDYIKGLIKKLKSCQKYIKFPARSQRSWYMSKSSRLLKIYRGIIVKSYIKDKSNDNIFMSFNEPVLHCLVMCLYHIYKFYK
jgi:hypothetical protein